MPRQPGPAKAVWTRTSGGQDSEDPVSATILPWRGEDFLEPPPPHAMQLVPGLARAGQQVQLWGAVRPSNINYNYWDDSITELHSIPSAG